MSNDTQLGIVGLGQIGGNLAKQALEKDVEVVGVTTSEHPDVEAMGGTVLEAGSYDELAARLDPPRLVYLSLPAGPLVDEELSDLVESLEEGDVVLDGGNSFWRDSMRRAERVRAEHGIYYLDAGTSGGLAGARNGACFMVGGPEEGYELARPMLERLSVDGGCAHVGPSGAGHFVKLVHNGVEFGMLQSIAEGVELLEAGDFDLDVEAVFSTWSNGSVIRSWLVELMRDGLAHRNQYDDETPEDFEDVPPYVEDTGEVNWLVQEAFKGEVPVPVIAQSVVELFKSRGNQREAPRAVALMRHGFGNHPYGEDEDIARERREGRVGNVPRQELEERGGVGSVLTEQG